MGNHMLRDVFISFAEVANDLLRQTEPQLHQKWERKPSPDIDDGATGFAKFLHEKVGKELRQFRSQFIERRVTTTRIRHKLLINYAGKQTGIVPNKEEKAVTPKEVRDKYSNNSYLSKSCKRNG